MASPSVTKSLNVSVVEVLRVIAVCRRCFRIETSRTTQKTHAVREKRTVLPWRYYSVTYQTWGAAEVVQTDARSGSVMINLKPGSRKTSGYRR